MPVSFGDCGGLSRRWQVALPAPTVPATPPAWWAHPCRRPRAMGASDPALIGTRAKGAPMSVETPRGDVAGRYHQVTYRESDGEGWMLFSGTMLVILGVMNIIGGIAAIDNANFYVG